MGFRARVSFDKLDKVNVHEKYCVSSSFFSIIWKCKSSVLR